MHNGEMITELFVEIDDFCQNFDPELDKHSLSSSIQPIKTTISSRLYESEIMTIVVFFHLSGMRNFKYFYGLQEIKSLQELGN